MAAMIIILLSQVVVSSIHEAGYALDQVFGLGVEGRGIDITTFLSRTAHYL